MSSFSCCHCDGISSRFARYLLLAALFICRLAELLHFFISFFEYSRVRVWNNLLTAIKPIVYLYKSSFIY